MGAANMKYIINLMETKRDDNDYDIPKHIEDIVIALYKKSDNIRVCKNLEELDKIRNKKKSHMWLNNWNLHILNNKLWLRKLGDYEFKQINISPELEFVIMLSARSVKRQI